MGKYQVEKIVLDEEALEADMKVELDKLVTFFAIESEQTEAVIRTRFRGLLNM